jgi:hypothetical protein
MMRITAPISRRAGIHSGRDTSRANMQTLRLSDKAGPAINTSVTGGV